VTRYLASGFHAPERGTIEPFTEALIEVEDGVITAFRQPGSDQYDPKRATRLPHILLPGFVDLHIHAPQYPQLGTALDVPLEDWLHRHTFPLEARYADLAFAQKVYRQLVADLLASGTTTALYFATVHVPATKALADICHAMGQRALIGKVAMDHPETCPDYYRDASTAEAVQGAKAVIDHIRALPGNLVHPVVTPRFIPACTDETLTALGRLAQETGTRVQTHVSESDWEHQYVLGRHGVSDTESLRRFGLLTPGSVLAHGPHLSLQDMQTLCDHRTGVAHCPLSNAYFAGAAFPLRAALEKGLRVGLGSDISGGPAGTIWEAARMAVAASRMLESGVNPALPSQTRGVPGARIDMATAFYLATTGGGAALELPVGHFAPGMEFDAIQIDPEAAQGTIRLWGDEPPAIRLERLIHTASRANIAGVWVAGRRVQGAA
jgi:guanine deaminase